jgi:RNA polymerase sigma-70 factor (ECF subfamily)
VIQHRVSNLDSDLRRAEDPGAGVASRLTSAPPDGLINVSDSTAAAENSNGSNGTIRNGAASSLDVDVALVDRIREGDREAFDELYGRYFKRIYAFLDKRLRNRADTEETTQEVFINVFSSIDSFRGEAPFAAWIFGLTRRTLASRFKRKRHPTVPLADEDEERIGGSLSTSTSPTATPDPLANYEMSERAEHLLHALEHELSPSQRRVFEMHHLQSVSIAEIARTLSKSEDSIKSSLYRSRKLLLAR